MADKPKRAAEYQGKQIELVRATCLYLATRLGTTDLDVGLKLALLDEGRYRPLTDRFRSPLTS